MKSLISNPAAFLVLIVSLLIEAVQARSLVKAHFFPVINASTAPSKSRPRHQTIERSWTTQIQPSCPESPSSSAAKASYFEDAKAHLDMSELKILGGANIDDVRTAFADDRQLDHVFSGAGIELDKRLEIVRDLSTSSGTTTVPLRNPASGPQFFLTFVEAVLDGLK